MNTDFVIKRVKDDEMKYTLLASSLGISPHTVQEGAHHIKTERYPMTLTDIIERDGSAIVWREKLLAQLHNLHSRGIIHCDLSEDNVVVNEKTGELKIIDYGMSKNISQMNECDKEEFAKYRPEKNNSFIELEELEAIFITSKKY